MPSSRAASLALVCLAAACATAPKRDEPRAPPIVQLTGTSVRDVSLEGLTLVLALELQNPSAARVQLSEAKVRLSVAAEKVIDVAVPLGLAVEPNASAAVEVPIRLEWATLPGVVPVALRGDDVPYRVDGAVALASPREVRLPFAHEGRLPLPRVPKVSFERSKVEQVGLSATAVRVGLKIDNPNPFPVKVELKDLKVLTAGAELVTLSAQDASVGAKASEELDLTGRLDLGTLGVAAKAVLGGEWPQPGLAGTVRVGSFEKSFSAAPEPARAGKAAPDAAKK